MSGATSKRVFVTDDHPIVLEGVGAVIARHRHLSYCGDADCTAKALEGIASTKPDIVLVDLSLNHTNGLDLIKRIRERHAALPILVWSHHPESIYAERALRAGANGYLEKSCASSSLIRAIEAVLSGKVCVSDAIAANLLNMALGASSKPAEGIKTLTDRELQVYELLGNGKVTRQIAKEMHVSPKTVETYRARIKEKLGLANSIELITAAVRWVMNKRTRPKPDK